MQGDVADLRAHEVSLGKSKRCRTSPDSEAVTQECLSKGAEETTVRRRSSGIRAACLPCGRVCGLRSMPCQESITQVIHFVADVLSNRSCPVKAIFYDYACGVRRALRNGNRYRRPFSASLQRIEDCAWIIDRMHHRGHRGCKNRDKGWFVERVHPEEHLLSPSSSSHFSPRPAGAQRG